LALMTIFFTVYNICWLSLAICKGRLLRWHWGATYAGFNAEVHWHLEFSLVASVYYCHFGNLTMPLSELPLAGFRDDLDHWTLLIRFAMQFSLAWC
jgi:hypothetical protein